MTQQSALSVFFLVSFATSKCGSMTGAVRREDRLRAWLGLVNLGLHPLRWRNGRGPIRDLRRHQRSAGAHSLFFGTQMNTGYRIPECGCKRFLIRSKLIFWSQ